MAGDVARERVLRSHNSALRIWLLIAMAVAVLGATPAAANAAPPEIQEYRHDFDVSAAKAEESLEVQKRGAAIVGEL